MVGSAKRCSSPTSAVAIARRMPSLGRVCVSLWRLTAPGTPVEANGPMDPPDMEQRIRAAFDRWNRGDYSFDPS